MTSSPSKSRPTLSRKPTRGESKAFSTAHQNVLLERMESSIRGIADGHVLLVEKFEGMEKWMDSMGEDLKVIKWDIKEMKGEIREVKGDIAELKLGQARLEEITSEILQRLKSVENRVAALEARLQVPPSIPVTSDDVADRVRQLEQRVAFLESHVA